MLGFVNLFKPAGPTSTQFGARLRRIYGGAAKKKLAVGHLGTLDPQAAGVLPIALGSATRLIPLIEDKRKSYVCTLVLGRSTATGDAEGAMVAESPVPREAGERLAALVPDLIGTIEQTPPMYSAVRVDGRRLYEHARAGITVERRTRKITIYGLAVIGEEDGNVFRLRIACSEGTYVRTLCEDLGRAIGCAAHMGALLRDGSGPFVLSESLTLEEIADDPGGSLIAPERVIPIPTIVLDGRKATDFCAGRIVPIENAPPDRHVFVRDSRRLLVGVGEPLGTLLAPRKVFV